MPRTSEQNEQAREEARDRLLGAALRLFATHGYEQTSIKQIAQEAQMAQGLLYHYFDNKEHLLQSVFARCMTEVNVSFASGEEVGAPTEKLERLLRKSFALVREQQDFWRLTYSLRFQSSVLAGLKPVMDGWIAAIRATLETHLRDTGTPNPATQAILLFAAVDGISQHYVIDPDNYPLDAVADALVAHFCRDFRPEGEEE